MKALRKCLKEEVETNKKMTERVKELEITLQCKDENIESLQMTNQRLVLRIETLQTKEQAAPKEASGGGWGSSFFGNSTQLTQELQNAKDALDVAQEELEAKMTENCKLHNLLLNIGWPRKNTDSSSALNLRHSVVTFDH